MNSWKETEIQLTHQHLLFKGLQLVSARPLRMQVALYHFAVREEDHGQKLHLGWGYLSNEYEYLVTEC